MHPHCPSWSRCKARQPADW
jgi:hypothetical protein